MNYVYCPRNSTISSADGTTAALFYEFNVTRQWTENQLATTVVHREGVYKLVASRVLDARPNDETLQRMADAYVWSPEQTRREQAGAAMLTFVLHVLPGGATWDYATQGEGWNAIGSGVGDAALLAGGVGLAVKAGKLVKAAGAIESVIGLYRSGEAIHLVVQEDYIGAAGSAGEALLRFLGAGAHLSAAKRLAAPASKAVQQGYRRVYRAVSEAEYQDILRTGQFRQGPNSLEGKWFADTVESAHAHGKALFGEGKFRLIEADVPKNAPSLFLHPNMDGFGPARFLDLNDLRRVRRRPVE